MGLAARAAMWMRSAIVLGARPRPPRLPAATSAAVEQAKAGRRKKRTARQGRSRTRWIQSDVERAQHTASTGDLSRAGQLYRALARDGMILGLLATRSNGLVRLPKRFSGCPTGIAFLEGAKGERGAFDRIFPPAEIAKLARDGFVLGVGVAEFIDTPNGRVLVRLDPEFLKYQWWDDTWYFQGAEDRILVTPGDGRWVLYAPGGRQEPWDQGAWAALGRAFVAKEHALLYRENWNTKLAHAARVAVAPQGATEAQKQGWFQKVMAWGMNTVFGMTPGYDVKLLESNGVGYQSFRETIADSNQEFMIIAAGQVVTVTGGAGFANADIHATIRGDLIEGDGRTLAATLNEQALPYALEGIVGAGERVDFEWDTRPPMNRKEEAEALSAAAQAVVDLLDALARVGMKPDVAELASRFGVPLASVAGALSARGLDGAVANDQEIEVVFDEGDELEQDEDEHAAEGEHLTDEAAAALAKKMTEHRVPRCEHGHSNRCWKCGIERVRDFEVGSDGTPVWTIGWRPLNAMVTAA